MWGTGRSDVWAVGSGLFHFDGATWTREGSEYIPGTFGLEYGSQPLGRELRDAHQQSGLRPNLVAPCASTEPKRTAPPARGGRQYGEIKVERRSLPVETAPSDTGPARAGQFSTWANRILLGTFGPLWGQSAKDVWAVGDQGLLAHWDGAT